MVKKMENVRLSSDYIDRCFKLLIKKAQSSPDPSTQNAALIVIDVFDELHIVSIGNNDFPSGVKPRLNRPEKYSFIEHAERNAIYEASREEDSTEGGAMVALWAACADCARGIIQSGIRTLYRHSFYSMQGHGNNMADRMSWEASTNIGDQMMREAGIDIVEYDCYSRGMAILFNGKSVILGVD